MTSPNFLSHIQHTGFIPQPGIGDVLGEQFRNLAQAKVVQTEMKQRQQQQDQLGEYYRGQNEEMMRLRDRQEAEARAQEMQSRQMEAKMAVIDKQFEVTPDMNERQAWDMRSKRALAMAEIGHPLAGTMSAILNSMRPKDDKNIVVPRDARVMGPDGQVLLDAAPTPTKGERGMIVETPAGQDFIDPITGATRRQFGPKPRAPSGSGEGGGLSPSQAAVERGRLRSGYRSDLKVWAPVMSYLSSTGPDTIERAVNRDPGAQIQVLYNFIHMMDDSTVREGEQALVRGAESLTNKMRNLYDKSIAGKSVVVSPDMVRSMGAIIGMVRKNMGGRQAKVRKYYQAQAGLSGLSDVDKLFLDIDEEMGGAPGGGDASNVDKLLNPSKP